jgi:hypothetical protein
MSAQAMLPAHGVLFGFSEQVIDRLHSVAARLRDRKVSIGDDLGWIHGYGSSMELGFV